MSQLLEKPLPPVIDSDCTVHEPETHGQDMQNMPDGATSFIRPIDIALERPGARMLTVYPHISEVLARADEELAKLAQLSGAKVIGHTWHLIQARPSHGMRLQHSLTEDISSYRRMGIPRGKALVAEVDLLRDIEPLDDAIVARVDETIGKYYADFDDFCENEEAEIPEYRGIILSAIDSGQFVTGVNASAGPEVPRGLWLPDIEPRLIWAP